METNVMVDGAVILIPLRAYIWNSWVQSTLVELVVKEFH